MRSGSSQFLLIAILLLAGFAGLYFTSNFLEKNRVALPEDYSDRDLEFQGKRLAGFALGGEGLLADWYWMRSLQYMGDKMIKNKAEFVDIGDLRSLNPRLLYPLLDNATDLDPHFMAAFSYGATVLPAIDPANAIALTEKGIRNNPEKWRLLQYLGYIYWRLGDFDKAADVYSQGAAMPGTPPFFKMMAAKMRTDSGSRETARAIYNQLLDDKTDQQTRENAELRLKRLDTLDELDAINGQLNNFRERNGRCANSLQEIVNALSAVKLSNGRDLRINSSGELVDTAGIPYLFNKAECRAGIDPKKSPLPIN